MDWCSTCYSFWPKDILVVLSVDGPEKILRTVRCALTPLQLAMNFIIFIRWLKNWKYNAISGSKSLANRLFVRFSHTYASSLSRSLARSHKSRTKVPIDVNFSHHRPKSRRKRANEQTKKEKRKITRPSLSDPTCSMWNGTKFLFMFVDFCVCVFFFLSVSFVAIRCFYLSSMCVAFRLFFWMWFFVVVFVEILQFTFLGCFCINAFVLNWFFVFRWLVVVRSRNDYGPDFVVKISEKNARNVVSFRHFCLIFYHNI